MNEAILTRAYASLKAKIFPKWERLHTKLRFVAIGSTNRSFMLSRSQLGKKLAFKDAHARVRIASFALVDVSGSEKYDGEIGRHS